MLIEVFPRDFTAFWGNGCRPLQKNKTSNDFIAVVNKISFKAIAILIFLQLMPHTIKGTGRFEIIAVYGFSLANQETDHI